jgi:hypothetical protein
MTKKRCSAGGGLSKVQRNDCYKIKSFWVDALPLVESRFDTKVKYLYIKAYVTSVDYSLWRDIYRQHLWVFNGFQEREPLKQTYEEFERSFNRLIDDFKNNEFDWELSPVPVVDGYAVNGAHRVSCALFFDSQVLCYESDSEAYLYDEDFFLTEGLGANTVDMVCRTFAKVIAL